MSTAKDTLKNIPVINAIVLRTDLQSTLNRLAARKPSEFEADSGGLVNIRRKESVRQGTGRNASASRLRNAYGRLEKNEIRRARVPTRQPLEECQPEAS